jgi:hypothetical protein
MDIYEEELWEYEQSLKRLQARAHAVNPTESNAP